MTTDDQRPKTAEARISLHAHWHQDNRRGSDALFQKYWDALPPLPKASSNRTRSLQLPVVSAVSQDTCADDKVSELGLDIQFQDSSRLELEKYRHM